MRKNKSKGIAINGIPIKKASELFGIFNVIFFSPEDLDIIKNGPAERLKYHQAGPGRTAAVPGYGVMSTR